MVHVMRRSSSRIRAFRTGRTGAGAVEDVNLFTSIYCAVASSQFLRRALPLSVFSLFSCFALELRGGGIFDPIYMGDKSREANQKCLRQIANMCRS